jgi:hypothetical protein
MAPLLIGLAAAGTLMNSYGKYKQAQAEARLMRGRARVKRIAAKETLYRNEINNSLLTRKSKTFQAEQEASIAGSGAQVGAESSLLILQDTAAKAIEQTINNTYAAEYDAYIKNIEADALERGASETSKAGKIGAAGGLLTGGARIGMAAS